MAENLISMDEWNDKKSQDMWRFQERMKADPTGIACPKCGAELFADRTITLTSNPPQTPVSCPKCGYNGSIY